MIGRPARDKKTVSIVQFSHCGEKHFEIIGFISFFFFFLCEKNPESLYTPIDFYISNSVYRTKAHVNKKIFL